MHCYV